MRKLPAAVTACFLFSLGVLSAAAQSSLKGTWSGTLLAGGQSLRLNLHLTPIVAAGFNCTLDSVDQGAMAIPCSVTSDNAATFAFKVPAVNGSWSGRLIDDVLTGSWTQGVTLPLSFSRVATTANTGTASPSGAVVPKITGVWLGKPVGTPLSVQIHLSQDASGAWQCSLDSPQQHARGIPCTLTSATEPIAFKVPSVGASFTGALSADGDTLSGTFTQGSATLPLIMARQVKAEAVTPPPAPDAAMPPVPLAELKAVLDHDLAAALAAAPLSTAQHGGITLGVIDGGTRRLWSYGTAADDSVYEIGSITKTMTATLLAQMVEQKLVTLDEPVRELLPTGTVSQPAATPSQPATGDEITLLSLSTQHSGLPRLPSNMRPASMDDPYADYTAARLYEYLHEHGVARAADAPFDYSNLGVGLLGQALSNRAKLPYPELLEQQVLAPLGMTSSGATLTPAMQLHVLPGHDTNGKAVPAWHLAALAGAGAVHSTAGDMLRYLAAELNPQALAVTGPHAATLPAALALTQYVRADAMPGEHIALNWFHTDATGTYWHNGATAGYSAYAAFNPARQQAVIVLANFYDDGSLADRLGQHVMQRLAGKPAVSLAPTP